MTVRNKSSRGDRRRDQRSRFAALGARQRRINRTPVIAASRAYTCSLARPSPSRGQHLQSARPDQARQRRHPQPNVECMAVAYAARVSGRRPPVPLGLGCAEEVLKPLDIRPPHQPHTALGDEDRMLPHADEHIRPARRDGECDKHHGCGDQHLWSAAKFLESARHDLNGPQAPQCLAPSPPRSSAPSAVNPLTPPSSTAASRSRLQTAPIPAHAAPHVSQTPGSAATTARVSPPIHPRHPPAQNTPA